MIRIPNHVVRNLAYTGMWNTLLTVYAKYKQRSTVFTHFKTIKRGLPEILNYIRNFREQIRVRVRLSFLYVVDPCHTGHVLQP